MAYKKIRSMVRDIKFFSPETAFYLIKFTIQPCMEYCCYVWVVAPNYFLDMLDKLQRQACMTVVPIVAASLEL